MNVPFPIKIVSLICNAACHRVSIHSIHSIINMMFVLCVQFLNSVYTTTVQELRSRTLGGARKVSVCRQLGTPEAT